MAERRVSVKFSAEIQNFKSAVAEGAAATEKLKKASEDAGKAADKGGKQSEAAANAATAAQGKHKEALEDVGRVATIGGAAVLAGVGLAVKAYADFDKQMSAVDAATHETAGNMDLLRQAAIDAGADTAFSAGEAAQGIEQMAKAGVSTKDILGGGLTGALSLAAAGSLDVGKAAEIAASAMTQFKLSGDKLPHVADLLAAGAGKAQGSVEDLGAALNQSGLVAAQTGLTIEETTGGLAAFASAGLVGSDAGTSFKSMLQRLTPQSKEAATLMEELGLSAYDSQGNFIGLSEYAGELQTALSSMTTEQRNATLGTLFGSDAIRAASVLYENGAAGVEKWENAVNDAGYAADTAARMQDNLAGDLEKLGGAFDTVLIQSGSGANDVLRGLVQGLEGVVDAVGKVPGPILGVGTGLAALVGGAALLGGGLITVIPKIRDTKDALEVLAPAGSKANDALSKTGKIAAGAATGLAAVAAASAIAQPALDQILKPTGETGDALEAFAGQAAQGAVGADTLNKSFQDLVEGRDGVGAFQGAIEGIADPGLWGNIDNIAVGTIKVLSLGMADVTSTSDKARERMKSLGEQLASLDADKAAQSFQDMAAATDGSDEKLKQLIDLMPAYRKTLEEQAKATGQATDDQTLLDIAMGKLPNSTDAAKASIEAEGKAAEAAAAQTQEIRDALEEVGVSADGTVTDLAKFTDALFNAGLLQLSARDAARGFEEAIDAMAESLANNGRTLDTTTEKGRANEAALDAIAAAGIRSADAMASNGATQEALQVNLQGTFDGLVAAARQFTDTDEEAQALARDIMRIPPGVDIKTWMDGEAKRIAADTKKAIEDIPKDVVINEQYNKYITEIHATIDRRSQLPDLNGDVSGSGRPGVARGGRVRDVMPGAAGGKVPGRAPSNLSIDNVLATVNGKPLAVQSEEWIINGRSSKKYDRELAAINAGTFPKMPGYVNGGRAREYSAQQLGYAPYRSTSIAAAGVTNNWHITTPANPVVTAHEVSRRQQSLNP